MFPYFTRLHINIRRELKSINITEKASKHCSHKDGYVWSLVAFIIHFSMRSNRRKEESRTKNGLIGVTCAGSFSVGCCELTRQFKKKVSPYVLSHTTHFFFWFQLMSLDFSKLCTTRYYFAVSRLTLWLVFLRRSHLSPHLMPRAKEEVNRVLMRVTEGSGYRRRVRVPPEMSQTPMKHLLTTCAWPPKGLRMRPRNPLFLVFASRVSASIIQVGLQYAPAS